MSVKKHSLKFAKLSKHASCLVANSRDEMSSFVTGASKDLVENIGQACCIIECIFSS